MIETRYILGYISAWHDVCNPSADVLLRLLLTPVATTQVDFSNTIKNRGEKHLSFLGSWILNFECFYAIITIKDVTVLASEVLFHRRLDSSDITLFAFVVNFNLTVGTGNMNSPILNLLSSWGSYWTSPTLASALYDKEIGVSQSSRDTLTSAKPRSIL